jgi:hypothetical protein
MGNGRLVVLADVDAVNADVLDGLQVRLHLLLSRVTTTGWFEWD